MTPNVEIENWKKKQESSRQFSKRTSKLFDFSGIQCTVGLFRFFPPAEHFPHPTGGAVAATTSVQ